MTEFLAWLPEPGIAESELEQLSTDETVALLLRRFRKLIGRGYGVDDALRIASHLELTLK